jgi:hypothetical protein
MNNWWIELVKKKMSGDDEGAERMLFNLLFFLMGAYVIFDILSYFGWFK